MWGKDAYISSLPELIGFWIVGAVNCSLPDFPCWALILKKKKSVLCIPCPTVYK